MLDSPFSGVAHSSSAATSKVPFPPSQPQPRTHPLPQTSLEASNLKYRDFLTVALMIRSDDLFPDNWIYIHDPRVKVGRIQNFRSWSEEMTPPGDIGCVGLEYFC